VSNEAISSLSSLFNNLKINAKVRSCRREHSFLIFDVILGPTGTYKKIEKYSTEIALSLKSFAMPLIYPVTHEGIVRIEILESGMEDVYFNEVVFEGISEIRKCNLPLAIGKKINNSSLVIDLTEMPHLLIAGTTGSGKSVLLHTIINNLLISKKKFRLALIDPKRVEFMYYEKISRMYAPVAKDLDASMKLLDDLIQDMEERFKILEKNHCRNISEYKGNMDYVIVVIDELADLMMASNKAAQDRICRLAQKSRACGIHLVVATQRPSVDVVTGLIKANFPIRISCQVSSATDSRVVLDKNGAEKLTGKGDAIIDGGKFKFERFKVSFISEDQIKLNVDQHRSWWNKIWNS